MNACGLRFAKPPHFKRKRKDAFAGAKATVILMKNSSAKEIISRLLLRSTALCVILTFVFFIAFAITQGGLSMAAMPFTRFLFVYLFSLAMVGALYLLKLPLPYGACLLLHYLASILALFLLFTGVGTLSFKRTSGIIAFFIFFTLLYAAVMGIYTLLRRRKSKGTKKEKEEPKYEKMF